MGKAGDHGSTATPPEVLEAIRRVSKTCRTRLTKVTPEIEVLARLLDADELANLTKKLLLGLQALHGLQQFMDAVATYLPMLDTEIAKLPSGPSRAQPLDDRRTFRSALRFWHKVAATELFQNAQLAADDPFVPKKRKALAVVHTLIFAAVGLVLEQHGIYAAKTAKGITCQVTAALINRFTDHKTTAVAVGSEVRRQLKRQDAALAALGCQKTA